MSNRSRFLDEYEKCEGYFMNGQADNNQYNDLKKHRKLNKQKKSGLSHSKIIFSLLCRLDLTRTLTKIVLSHVTGTAAPKRQLIYK